MALRVETCSNRTAAQDPGRRLGGSVSEKGKEIRSVVEGAGGHENLKTSLLFTSWQ